MGGTAPKQKPESQSKNLAPPLQELHNSVHVQTKLEIGKPGDKFEQEADQMADTIMMAPYDRSSMVMMAPNPDNPTLQMQPMPKTNMVMMAGSPDNPTLRMKSQVQKSEEVDSGEEEEVQMQTDEGSEKVQMMGNGDDEEIIQPEMDEDEPTIQMAMHEEDEPTIQMAVHEEEGLVQAKPAVQKAEDGTSHASPELTGSINSTKGSGSPLPKGTKQELGSKMGTDFSDVNIHTDSKAIEMSSSIGAKAFTHGSDIYFNKGNYNPESSSGKHLLAHELTHTIQQTGGVARKENRERIAKADDEETKKSADIIIDALDGITTSGDSAIMLKEFVGKDQGTISSIISQLKSKASAHDVTSAGMIDWLIDDLTAEDKRTLIPILAAAGIPDMSRIIAKEVLSYLQGYTSESNAKDILALFKMFTGTSLDQLLINLEGVAGMGKYETAAWLFSDLDRSSAENLSQQFFNSGGSRAAEYAAERSARNVESLIAGFTSIADSASIVQNFTRVPSAHQAAVLERFNTISTARWGESAEQSLMEDMHKADYVQLTALGLKLAAHNLTEAWWEKIISGILTGAEWALIVVEVVVGALIGIVTGIITFLGEIVGLVVDLVSAAYNLIMSFFYLVSGGAVGSAEWLATKEFFQGIGKIFSDPVGTFTQLKDSMVQESELIEGPLEYGRRAEYWARKITVTILTVVTIVKGLVKLAKKGGKLVKGAKTKTPTTTKPPASEVPSTTKPAAPAKPGVKDPEVKKPKGPAGAGGNRWYRSIDDFRAAIARGENVFYVGKHSDMRPRPTGVQSHHGVNSVWMKNKYSNYTADKAPSVFMLNNPNHNATRGVFNRWRSELAKIQNVKITKIDYAKVSKSDILELAKRQFDAANVPKIVSDEYYKLWEEYLTSLTLK